MTDYLDEVRAYLQRPNVQKFFQEVEVNDAVDHRLKAFKRAERRHEIHMQTQATR